MKDKILKTRKFFMISTVCVIVVKYISESFKFTYELIDDANKVGGVIEK